ncbi:aldehyde dehydrogenase family protein [Mycobacteroides salmoniphilum]|uniref:aldehyde dehydrogenase family protein n=1 Tax=Mycobacteroides salmoniphilum TaxID=404941 RepID=UPI001065EAE7|nr:aldehyde dehydrogenase family protein [Mycobacteroides salmoniphilum]TDZ92854.1 putative succinate-semialdehyde dehydrogenase [NADP(+)] 2 [Mycobacteroides salmoniphilum]
MTTTSENLATAAHNAARDVRNPANGQVVGQVNWTDPSDVPVITAQLAKAQPSWERLGPEGRGKVLARFAQWLTDNTPRIEAQLIAETGKSKIDAGIEIPSILAIIAYYAPRAAEFLTPESRPASSMAMNTKKITLHQRPRKVVGVISPWNYPVALGYWDVIPALLAGCSVLLKPSERTPLSDELIARGWEEIGAPPVFEIVQGAREVGEALIDNVDFIQFTGSTATGKKIMERAARRLTPVSLELGGKDPMLVLSDADVKRAAHAAVWGAMFNAGQTCVSVERVYVHDSIYEQFVDLVVDEVRSLEIGAGLDHSVGAMIDENQLEIVDQHVRQAVSAGARALTGGARVPGGGTFYAPTVLVDVDHSMDCMREETFGPTLPIMRFSEESKAIALANDSVYGLSASVWSKDRKRAERIALQLDCGTVNINDVIMNLSCLTAPHGGWKGSGMGSRFGGASGLLKYCRTEAIVDTRVTLPSEPLWYSGPSWLAPVALKSLTKLSNKALRPFRR